ncbi:hypothetical protein [Alkalilimnicola sp. S0819]|uniref:hypothetical protein n=1 Tax=Alkalilimnicola sp. S0819 TaxID=2613922 RepID=UPI0012623668|nr:hypothetical protein [Alkalilimnicola sp. S0819]KAB7622998.1 hypothetical protein F3N43_10730 [Alkalilimnicola sp. S0819]MPQ17110.1 hypothetical protein [Alkalilimnicola sp. S0819]
MRHPFKSAASALLILLIAGCGSSGPNTELERQQAGKSDTKNPFLQSEASWDNDEPGLFDDLFGNRKQEEQLAEQTSRIEQLERELIRRAAEGSAPSRTPERTAALEFTGVRNKVGVLLGEELAGSALGGQIGAALAGVAPDYPLSLVGQTELQRALRDARCGEASVDCARALALYPGLRVLSVVELAERDEDRLVLRIQEIDTALGIDYPAHAVHLPVVDAQVPRLSLEALGDKLLLSALERSRIAPWFTRAFAAEGEDFYLAAGAESGLKPGDRLAVRDGGKIIRSPSGSVAAWMPGAHKGVLEVVSLAGNDLAIARLVSGQAPREDDPITLAD